MAKKQNYKQISIREKSTTTTKWNQWLRRQKNTKYFIQTWLWVEMETELIFLSLPAISFRWENFFRIWSSIIFSIKVSSTPIVSPNLEIQLFHRREKPIRSGSSKFYNFSKITKYPQRKLKLTYVVTTSAPRNANWKESMTSFMGNKISIRRKNRLNYLH